MPLESRIVERILSHLKGQYGERWYGIKVHGDAYMVNQPDIIGCLDGFTLVIECKREGEKSRPGQAATQHKWRNAGACVVADATSYADVERALNEFLLEPITGTVTP